MEPFDVLGAGRMAVFADPTGAVLSVWQPLRHPGAGVVNEPGALCWNELTTRDVEAATRFYEAAFGWRGETTEYGSTTYTEWKLGERAIGGMIRMNDEWPADVPAHWMVYFAVEDADAAATKVEELGGTVPVAPTDTPAGRFAVVNDPQGALFSIIRLTAREDGDAGEEPEEAAEAEAAGDAEAGGEGEQPKAEGGSAPPSP
jgi:predicted enzyme related to lactoylglutathione lyase